LEPAAVFVVRTKRSSAHGQKQHGTQQQAQKFSSLSHGFTDSFFAFSDWNGVFSKQFDSIISDYDNQYKYNFVNLS